MFMRYFESIPVRFDVFNCPPLSFSPLHLAHQGD